MPDYYLAVHPDPKVEIAAIWTFDNEYAIRVDAPQRAKILSGTPPEVVVEDLLGFQFARLKLAPGEYYPRIARASNKRLRKSPGFNPETASFRQSIEVSNGQLVALKNQLESICRVVHPNDRTLEVYGHEIRNLLILASTEVETHWKAVLVANEEKA